MFGKFVQKKHKKSKFKLDLSYVFLIIFSCLNCNLFLFLIYSICIVLHECAHIFVAQKLGYSLQEFRLSVTGATACFGDNVFYLSDELIIALSGPMFNLCSFLIVIASWWLFPVLYNFTLEFAFVNLFIFAFNMLPVYSLDGGRILMFFLEKHVPRKKARRIVVSLGIGLSFLLFLLFLFSCFSEINFSLGAMAILLFVTCNGGKNDFLSITEQNKVDALRAKMGIQICMFYISDQSLLIDAFRKLSRKTYSIFYVTSKNDVKTIKVDEEQLKALIKKYGPCTSFDYIYKNNQS